MVKTVNAATIACLLLATVAPSKAFWSNEDRKHQNAQSLSPQTIIEEYFKNSYRANRNFADNYFTYTGRVNRIYSTSVELEGGNIRISNGRIYSLRVYCSFDRRNTKEEQVLSINTGDLITVSFKGKHFSASSNVPVGDATGTDCRIK